VIRLFQTFNVANQHWCVVDAYFPDLVLRPNGDLKEPLYAVNKFISTREITSNAFQ
jgi:hypothetical protein